MKLVILLTVLAVALARPEDSFYDDKYDSFNVKELTGNVRLLRAYVLCFQSKGKCTPEGTVFKNRIPEALETECGKCTGKQKIMVAEILKAIIELLPAEWDELVKIYKEEGQNLKDITVFIDKYAPK
ncbi:PREDICTED: ejaculatory bulb-specific protein 3-like [Papilio xuthus]|uniref:Ejaculatory bulb-specific protein 3-like n=1 Tax=Papilio xuthus TaxID=66420 RepID=A0AAJ6Z0G5_PAPXU|nr:PREDICTED: ejaculatory bulb-specific protein 3-like [Papilio xuthus]